jgi:hypothetical protein
MAQGGGADEAAHVTHGCVCNAVETTSRMMAQGGCTGEKAHVSHGCTCNAVETTSRMSMAAPHAWQQAAVLMRRRMSLTAVRQERSRDNGGSSCSATSGGWRAHGQCILAKDRYLETCLQTAWLSVVQRGRVVQETGLYKVIPRRRQDSKGFSQTASLAGANCTL